MPFLTTDPLDPAALIGAVAGAGHGGSAVFVGSVRDHHAGRGVSRLDYSAYPPMAERVAREVLAEAGRRWPVRVVARHRIGQLAVGEVAIVVAVGSAHREAAFEACRWVVDELKGRVPIWKHEHYADGGAAWVDPTAAAAVP